MGLVDTSIDNSAAVAHRQNQIRSELLLRALRKNHGADTKVVEEEVQAGPVRPRAIIKPAIKYWFHMDDYDSAVEEPAQPRIEDIKRTVCDYFKISRIDLTSDRRMHECARPRMIGMYLARQYTKKSLPEIARRFGRVDHSTTYNAVKRIKHLCQTDWKVAHDVAHLEARFQ